MDEDELRTLLQHGEPPVPPCHTSKLVAILTTGCSPVLSSRAGPAQYRPQTVAPVWAAVTTIVAVAACIWMLTDVRPSSLSHADHGLATYHELKSSVDALEREFAETLMESDANHAVLREQLRASEGLWMLINERDEKLRADDAQMIVNLFPETPAAERCRREFLFLRPLTSPEGTP